MEAGLSGINALLKALDVFIRDPAMFAGSTTRGGRGLAMQWTPWHDTVNAASRSNLWPQGMKTYSCVMATVPGGGPGAGFADAGRNIILDLTQSCQRWPLTCILKTLPVTTGV